MFIPAATYRLQFNRNFTFDQARGITPYLERMGMGACYASPIFKARAGSDHGYDIVDHQTINPELGGAAAFRRFANSLKRRRLGLLLDVVPNHMCISESSNQWWNDVLENGVASSHAASFDIDWHPPKKELTHKILLPELGDQFGRELENQKIRIVYEDGAFWIRYYSNRYPVAPRSWPVIIDTALSSLNGHRHEANPALLELQSIQTALTYLPGRGETSPEKIREREREKEIIAHRLSRLLSSKPSLSRVFQKTLDDINGTKGNPQSFDRLEDLLKHQTYRLCYWKVAADEINYRRFFDVNHLAAIRVEEPATFDAVHRLVFDLVKKGLVTGLRIDHVDGLLDPMGYLTDLQNKIGDVDGFYVVVEKVLLNDEKPNPNWKIQGTTGYDFLNTVNGLFIEGANKKKFTDLYARFTGLNREPNDVVAASKKLILLVSLASELHVLASKLDKISEQHRWSRDFTYESLRFALREVIAHFPAYRSYIRDGQKEVAAEDERLITTAIFEAKRRNPATSESIFDFIADVLLLKDPEGLTETQIADRRKFVLRFQQLTSPVMAKGIEDTAFYRYFPLCSVNDVGASLTGFGVGTDVFHQRNKSQLKLYPDGLLTTTTHDTKRSEDVRARINVLSEMPARWYRNLLRWSALNKEKKTWLNGYVTPDANEEYLLYQTLIGTWPLEPLDLTSHQVYLDRIIQYMLKALREAKIHTSWINPNTGYEDAVSHFVRSILELSPENTFLMEFKEFLKPVIQAGLCNSLSQIVLKITSPGVPDFYQGTELWNFSLVDPDNRHPVNFARIAALFADLEKEISKNRRELAARLANDLSDDRAKLYVTHAGLNLRKRMPALFQRGDYIPLDVEGDLSRNTVAFARVLEGKSVITVATRFLFGRDPDNPFPIRTDLLENTRLLTKNVPVERGFKNILTGDVVTGMSLKECLGSFPVAVLENF